MRRLARETGPNRLHQGVVAGARTVYVAETYAPLHEQVDTLHIPRAYTRSTVFAKSEPLWGVYKDYTPQRSTTTTQGVVVSRYPTDARTDGFVHLNN